MLTLRARDLLMLVLFESAGGGDSGPQEPERELARINGLGRGGLIGFRLIVTDREIIGIDTRSRTFRLWLVMLLGIGLAMILGFSIIQAEYELGLFGINPLVSFFFNLFLVFAIPIGMVLLVPRLLRRRIDQADGKTVRAQKKDIMLIETRKPSTITGKGRFRVRLVNGTSFNFWTIDKGAFDYVNSVLTEFAPRQILDASTMTQESTDIETDRPSNKLLLVIIEALILAIVLGAATLSPGEIVDIIFSGIFAHTILILGYLLQRRSRRLRRKKAIIG